MTLAVLGVLFLSAAVMVTGHFVGFVIGTILYQVASVLDGCDGEIARVRFLESPRGAALDTSVDLFGHQLFVLALGIGLWRYWALAPNAALTYLWEGILTTVGIALALKGVARFSPRPGATEFHDFGESVVRKSSIPGALRPMAFFIAALLRRDSYALIFVFLAAYGRPEWVLHCLAFGVAAHFPGIAWLWWKQSGFSVPRDARTVPGA
jgi:CDP-L-myo-inositol myo-inositolphosphotransferase